MTSAGSIPLRCYVHRTVTVGWLYARYVLVEYFIQICRYSVGWLHCSLKCAYKLTPYMARYRHSSITVTETKTESSRA